MRALFTSVLLVLALAAGAWKILDLSAANRELARQNQAYLSSAAEIRRGFEELRRTSPKPGSAAAAFTLLGADGAPVRFDPRSEPGPWHLLFLEPGSEDFQALLTNYGDLFGRSAPAARVLIVAAAGYERVRAALARRPAPYAVAVHAAEVYQAYGFLDGPGLAVVEGGTLRQKWRLPYRRDQLPVD